MDLISAAMRVGLLGGLVARAGPANPRPITQADEVVAIYAQDWGRAAHGMPRLILVAWGDGHVVWSEDRVQGGPPYLTGDIPPARVSAVLERTDRDGAFRDKRLAQPCFGPDSSFTTVLFRKAGRQLKMDSWHELAEASGRVVARSCALASLPANERRLEVLRKEPSEYLYYRVVWGELRALASSLVPAVSRRAAGEVALRGGVMTWREVPSR
jgi:hypothetical protein